MKNWKQNSSHYFLYFVLCTFLKRMKDSGIMAYCYLICLFVSPPKSKNSTEILYFLLCCFVLNPWEWAHSVHLLGSSISCFPTRPTYGRCWQKTVVWGEREVIVFVPLPLCVDGVLSSNPAGASGKEPACQCRRHKRCGLNPWVGKILCRRKWHLIPMFLPRESNGMRSLEGYHP